MKPKVKSSQYIHRGFYDIRQDLLQRDDGLTHSYTCLKLPTDATAILAQDTEGRWILNREYRHPTGDYILGCPGGRLEPGESPIIGAQRELFEETGYWSDEIELLGCCYPCPSLCDQKIYFLWAKNALKKGGQKLEPFEFISTELKSSEELRSEMLAKTNIDGVLCTALWYKGQFC